MARLIIYDYNKLGVFETPCFRMLLYYDYDYDFNFDYDYYYDSLLAPPMPGQPFGSQQPTSQPNFSGPPMSSAGPQIIGSGPPGTMMQRGMPGSMPSGMPGGVPNSMQGSMAGPPGPSSGPINSPMQQPARKIDPDQMPSPVS